MSDPSRDGSIGVILEFVAGMQRRQRRIGPLPVGDLRLNRTQVDALFLITHGTGDVTPGRLASALGVTAGAVSQLIEALRTAGLVEQLPHPSDARSRLLRLTPSAEREVAAFERKTVADVADLFRGLTGAELADVAASLSRVERA